MAEGCRVAIGVTGAVEVAGGGYVTLKIRFLCSYAAEIQSQSGGIRSTGNLVQEVAIDIKHLYAAITRIGDVNLIFAVDRNAVGPIGIRLPVKAARLMVYGLFTTKGQYPFIARYAEFELLDIAPLPVRDIDIALAVGCHMGGF